VRPTFIALLQFAAPDPGGARPAATTSATPLRRGRAEQLCRRCLRRWAAARGGGADLRAHAGSVRGPGPPGPALGWRPSLITAGMDPESHCWPWSIFSSTPGPLLVPRSPSPWVDRSDVPVLHLTCRPARGYLQEVAGGRRWLPPVPGVVIRRSHQPGLRPDAASMLTPQDDVQEQSDPAWRLASRAPPHGGVAKGQPARADAAAAVGELVPPCGRCDKLQRRQPPTDCRRVPRVLLALEQRSGFDLPPPARALATAESEEGIVWGWLLARPGPGRG